jgi:hypothetical protein
MSPSETVKSLPEYQCLAEVLGRIETCDAEGGASYRAAVDDCLCGLAMGLIAKPKASMLLEYARDRLVEAAEGRGLVLKLRLENLVDAIGTVLLDQLVEAAAEIGGRGKRVA